MNKYIIKFLHEGELLHYEVFADSMEEILEIYSDVVYIENKLGAINYEN